MGIFRYKKLKKILLIFNTSRIYPKIHFDTVKIEKILVGRQVMFILSKVIQ